MTKRKNEEEYVYRNWKQKDMEEAVSESATTEISTTSLAKKHHVPITTLKDRIGRGDAKAKVGHPKFFKKKERDYIASFTQDCKEIGFPRRKRDLKKDIEHVIVKKRKTKCPFRNNQPGKSWFDNMRDEYKEEFPVYSDDDNDDPIFKERLNLREWSQRKRAHIIKYNQLQLLDSRSRVFVMELDCFQFDKNDKSKSVRMAVCYNADGCLLTPIFLNSGYFHQNTMRRHLGRITFLWSEKGSVDRDIVFFMVLEVGRYMRQNKISGPVVLWITPMLFESVSLLAWMDARKNGIVLEVIPQHLYDSFRLTNRGVFDKIVPALDKELVKRSQALQPIVTFHGFCDMFLDVWSNIGLRSHLTKSCQGYKLCHLRRKRRTNAQEQQTISGTENTDIGTTAAKERTYTHLYALPPFTHLRLRYVPAAKDTSQSDRDNSLQPVQNPPSAMAPFDTGVMAYKRNAAIEKPVNPLAVVATPVRMRSKENTSKSVAQTTASICTVDTTESSNNMTMARTARQTEKGNKSNCVSFTSKGTDSNYGTITDVNNEYQRQTFSQSSEPFQYSYNDDCLYVCEVAGSGKDVCKRLIKVESQDWQNPRKRRKMRSKAHVVIKSEDTTDSD